VYIQLLAVNIINFLASGRFWEISEKNV